MISNSSIITLSVQFYELFFILKLEMLLLLLALSEHFRTGTVIDASASLCHYLMLIVSIDINYLA